MMDLFSGFLLLLLYIYLLYFYVSLSYRNLFKSVKCGLCDILCEMFPVTVNLYFEIL